MRPYRLLWVCHDAIKYRDKSQRPDLLSETDNKRDVNVVKTIDQVAEQYFGGNLAAMARANNISAPLLSRYKSKGWVVVNGVLMTPRRQLVDANGNPIRDCADQSAER